MLNLLQFRDHIVRPTLDYLQLGGLAAERLLIGTALAESGLHWIHQVNGPAGGPYQSEPPTTIGNLTWLSMSKPDISARIRSLFMRWPLDVQTEIHGNLYLATAMCRIHYLRVEERLPSADDLGGMAAYWKKYYNTSRGKGTVHEFIRKAEPVLELR